MEAVHILFRSDGRNGIVRVEVRRQRKLDKDAVDRLVRIQRRDQIEKPRLADIGGRAMLDGMETEFARQLELASHIDLARRVLAGKHHREPGRAAGSSRERCGALGHLPLDLGGHGHAVQDLCFSHRLPFLFGCVSRGTGEECGDFF